MSSLSTTLLKPILTERSLFLRETDRYAFWVNLRATKSQIVEAFIRSFSVKPEKINTVVVKGKSKTNWKTRRARLTTTRKKAIITLPKGTKIDVLQINIK